MSDQIRLCFDLEDQPFLEGLLDQEFIEVGHCVECQAVGEFSGAHPEKTSRTACDEFVDLPEDGLNVRVDRDQGNGQIVLKNAISAIQRAVGLGINGPIAAAEIIRAGARAGFQEIALKAGEPELFLSGSEGYLSDIFKEGFFIRDDRDRDAFKLAEDAAGERRIFNRSIKKNALYVFRFFQGHALMVTAPFGLEKRKIFSAMV